MGTLGLLALVLVAFVAARGAYDMYGKFTSAAAARATAESDLQALQERHTAVKADVVSLESERGLEGELRERYGVARPGEGEIAIVRQSTSSEAIVAPHETLLERLWQLLFVW